MMKIVYKSLNDTSENGQEKIGIERSLVVRIKIKLETPDILKWSDVERKW